MPVLTSFAALGDKYKMKPGALNILVTKVADGATHYTVNFLSTAEKATVATWIDSL